MLFLCYQIVTCDMLIMHKSPRWHFLVMWKQKTNILLQVISNDPCDGVQKVWTVHNDIINFILFW